MDLLELLKICKAYSDMGWSIQEQLHQLAEDGDFEPLNFNAVRHFDREFLALVERTVTDDEQLVSEVADLRNEIAEEARQ